jgi:hypothetical protein
VRPQPKQYPLAMSMEQTRMQGEAITWRPFAVFRSSGSDCFRKDKAF